MRRLHPAYLSENGFGLRKWKWAMMTDVGTQVTSFLVLSNNVGIRGCAFGPEQRSDVWVLVPAHSLPIFNFSQSPVGLLFGGLQVDSLHCDEVPIAYLNAELHAFPQETAFKNQELFWSDFGDGRPPVHVGGLQRKGVNRDKDLAGVSLELSPDKRKKVSVVDLIRGFTFFACRLLFFFLFFFLLPARERKEKECRLLGNLEDNSGWND
jgi:hypothetical protein